MSAGSSVSSTIVTSNKSAGCMSNFMSQMILRLFFSADRLKIVIILSLGEYPVNIYNILITKKIVHVMYLIQCVNNSMSNDMSMNIIITKWQPLVERIIIGFYYSMKNIIRHHVMCSWHTIETMLTSVMPDVAGAKLCA